MNIKITVDGIDYRPFDHLYAVSRCGKVIKGFKQCKPKLHPAGYLQCSNRLIHRMVATVWIRKPEEGEDVHHVNHDKQDNRVENLEIVSRRKHLVEKHPDQHATFTRTGPSEEGRAKLRKLRLGTKHSPETKAKISESLKAKGHKPKPRTGKRSSEELAKRAENPTRSTSCVINGVEYISFAAAARDTGIHRFTVRKRCLSPNFPEYHLG